MHIHDSVQEVLGFFWKSGLLECYWLSEIRMSIGPVGRLFQVAGPATAVVKVRGNAGGTRGNAVPGSLIIAGERSNFPGPTQPLMVQAG